MFCMNCGNRISDGSKFCHVCGAALSAAPQPVQQTAPRPVQQAPQQMMAEPPQPQAYSGQEEKPKGFSSKKLIVIILVVVGLFAAGLAVFALTDVFGEDEPSLQLAQRYLSEENYEQAIIEFERLLEIDPKNVDAYMGLAEVSDGSAVQNPIQSLTNMVYLTGESYAQLRAEHEPAIQATIDELNDYINSLS